MRFAALVFDSCYEGWWKAFRKVKAGESEKGENNCDRGNIDVNDGSKGRN